MSAGEGQQITQEALLRTHYAFFALTTSVVVARIAIHIIKRRPFELQDGFAYLAYALFVSMWACYVVSVPKLYRLVDVGLGKLKPYPTIVQEAGEGARLVWTAQLLYYGAIVAVKFSLLTLYRKLLVGLRDLYHIIWWGIAVAILLSWIGCIVSSAMSCPNMREFFSNGTCVGPHSRLTTIISLVYTYVVDVVTDLMVMFLPVHLCWNLSISRIQKIGVYSLFCSGFVCILFATLRFAQAGFTNGKIITPDPKWMQVWTTLETSMAVLVSCVPAFASLLRRQKNSKKPSHGSRGYVKQTSSKESIHLGNMETYLQRPESSERDIQGVDGGSHHEEHFASNSRDITVTTTVQVSGGRSTQ